MGIVTWILLGVIILVAVGLGVGVFFGGLFRGAEIVGENPTVQNATQEAQQFIENSTNGAIGNAMISVTTDKAVYDKGDTVKITVKNTGTDTKTFPNAALGLEVKNTDSGIIYSMTAAQVVTDLGSGESKTITWQDNDAPVGNYQVTARTSDGAYSQTSFEIRG